MTAAATDHKTSTGNLNFILVCVFIDMLGIGLIIPVLPPLVGQFVTGREQQALWYGILATVFGLMQFIFMPMLGAASDRIGRRPVLIYSMAGMCINFLTTAWAPNLACLFIGRVIGGMSSASMSVAMAYASDVTSHENRAKSFGKVGAAFGLGFICGPMLGGLLGSTDLRLPFYVAAAMSAANLVYGYFVVPESLPANQRAPMRWDRVNPLGSLARLVRRRDIRELVIVVVLVTFAQMMLQSTWVLYTTFRFNWTPRDNGLAMFCVGLASVVVQAGLLAVLMRRFGEVRLSLLGLASGAVTYLLYGLATQGWMMYLFILCNLLAFAAGPAMQGIISKTTPSNEQGELMGSLQSIGSLGVVVMPLVGTSILGAVSHLPANDWRIGATFYVCAAMQTVATVVAYRYFARRRAAA
ncbi:TCR/Tet family MFS transporter [Massilia horti]|uniref:MFS transporter n=1 Tax=Massilia horti TaxID=2562153 RepID=A0A4Y9T2N0_9BURK|nr:TCR/Tet family MFS transporter [Massilia horti]TFW31861.1 MFS transporter [Massilia horti]